MLEDLNHYFGATMGIVGAFEKRNKKYLALIRLGEKDLLRSKGGDPMHESDKFYSIQIRNEKIGDLLNQLIFPLQDSPQIIDETGYSEAIDISLSCRLSNVDDLNKALEKYGLKLILKEMEMEVGVVKMKTK
jgi:hypothetical protein